MVIGKASKKVWNLCSIVCVYMILDNIFFKKKKKQYFFFQVSIMLRTLKAT